MPNPVASISLAEARRMALFAQGLSGTRLNGAPAMLDQLGAVQLDTISVLARSHLLVAWARLGSTSRATVESTYWPEEVPSTFEYWAHAACILPIKRWPDFAFRRRARLLRGRRWHRLEDADRTLREVRARLAGEGPLTAGDLGGAKGAGPWWDWTESKIAVEWLLDIGEVVCVRRQGWRRVYDLAERSVPAELLVEEKSDDECRRVLVADAGRALGVASIANLAHHHHMTIREATSALAGTGLVEVAVEGEKASWYAHPDALAALGTTRRSRTTLLSPFDSLLWDRSRTERLFGLAHRLEAYTPAAKRIHGYFAMPVLAGGELVGRVDPKREKDVLVAAHVSFSRPRSASGVAKALREAASWIGASAVRVDRVTPETERAPLLAALADFATSSSPRSASN